MLAIDNVSRYRGSSSNYFFACRSAAIRPPRVPRRLAGCSSWMRAANLSVADSVGSHACGERSRAQAEPVSFAHGHAKKAYRASWRGLAVVIKEPLSRSGQDVARFRSMILIDDQARSNVARSAPDVLSAFARVYATCTSFTTPFQIVERLQPFETAISSLSWIPRLQVARQVAEFGLRLKQADLVNCDWKPEQTALNAVGAFRIVDTKNFRSVSRSVANCSATYQCIRQGCNIWGPRPREGQRKPRILPEHRRRLHVQKRCARIAWGRRQPFSTRPQASTLTQVRCPS